MLDTRATLVPCGFIGMISFRMNYLRGLIAASQGLGSLDLTNFVSQFVPLIVSRGSFEIVLLGVVPEGPEAHPEQFGGPHLDPACPVEGLGDVFPLEPFDVLFHVEAGFREGAGGRRSPG